MKNTIILGLIGKAGSGKDTVADTLVEERKFKKVAFADPLKLHCKNFHGWDGNKDLTGRSMLQTEGTDKHRKHYPSIWIDYMKIKIKMMIDDGVDRIVISDVRFNNEAKLIKKKIGFFSSFFSDTRYKWNGFNIKIIGRETDLGASANHSSETGIKSIPTDFIVDNGGSIENTKEQDFYIVDEEIRNRMG